MEVTDILKQCTVEGNTVKLPGMQLDRGDYMKVKAAMLKMGGKWKGGKAQGFVFGIDPSGLIGQAAGGEVRNVKKEYQFFETPARLAAELVDMAAIDSMGHSVLEPSAGRGAIVRALNNKGTVPDCFELMGENRAAMEGDSSLRFNMVGHDFLEGRGNGRPKYDRIVANPPFSRNQDIEHVMEMWGRLGEGGRIVSVASVHWQHSGNRKETAFREWLGGVGAVIEPLPPEAFKESGTMVRTCVLIIDK
jgi:hypothetical protein